MQYANVSDQVTIICSRTSCLRCRNNISTRNPCSCAIVDRTNNSKLNFNHCVESRHQFRMNAQRPCCFAGFGRRAVLPTKNEAEEKKQRNLLNVYFDSASKLAVTQHICQSTGLKETNPAPFKTIQMVVQSSAEDSFNKQIEAKTL